MAEIERRLNDKNTAVFARYRELATTIAFMISLDYVKALRTLKGKKKGILNNKETAEYEIKNGEDFFENKLALYLNDPTIDPKRYAAMLEAIADDDEKYDNFKKFKSR